MYAPGMVSLVSFDVTFPSKVQEQFKEVCPQVEFMAVNRIKKMAKIRIIWGTQISNISPFGGKLRG
jgi:hypothetical protein